MTSYLSAQVLKIESYPSMVSDKKGVFTIREMHEAEDFKAFVEDKNHVVIIGGGVQGLETAWSIHRAVKRFPLLKWPPD